MTDRRTDGRTDKTTTPKTTLAYARAVKITKFYSSIVTRNVYSVTIELDNSECEGILSRSHDLVSCTTIYSQVSLVSICTAKRAEKIVESRGARAPMLHSWRRQCRTSHLYCIANNMVYVILIRRLFRQYWQPNIDHTILLQRSKMTTE